MNDSKENVYMSARQTMRSHHVKREATVRVPSYARLVPNAARISRIAMERSIRKV